MKPIPRRDAAVSGVFSAQNLLADQRYHDGVVHIVVGRITIGNIFQCEAPNKTNDVGIGGLEDSINLTVHVSKMLDKRLDNNFCRVKHNRLPWLRSGCYSGREP